MPVSQKSLITGKSRWPNRDFHLDREKRKEKLLSRNRCLISDFILPYPEENRLEDALNSLLNLYYQMVRIRLGSSVFQAFPDESAYKNPDGQIGVFEEKRKEK